MLNLRTENPTYWAKRVEASDYTETEIVLTLEDIEAFNAQVETFKTQLWDTVLTWQDEEGGYMGDYGEYDTDDHKALATKLQDLDIIRVGDKQNGQYGLPVRTWQNNLKSAKRLQAKIQKMADKLQ